MRTSKAITWVAGDERLGVAVKRFTSGGKYRYVVVYYQLGDTMTVHKDILSKGDAVKHAKKFANYLLRTPKGKRIAGS